MVVPTCKKAKARDAPNQVVWEYGIPEFGLHNDNVGKKSGNHTNGRKCANIS